MEEQAHGVRTCPGCGVQTPEAIVRRMEALEMEDGEERAAMCGKCAARVRAMGHRPDRLPLARHIDEEGQERVVCAGCGASGPTVKEMEEVAARIKAALAGVQFPSGMGAEVAPNMLCGGCQRAGAPGAPAGLRLADVEPQGGIC